MKASVHVCSTYTYIYILLYLLPSLQLLPPCIFYIYLCVLAYGRLFQILQFNSVPLTTFSCCIGAKLHRLEQEKGIVVRFMISHDISPDFSHFTICFLHLRA